MANWCINEIVIEAEPAVVRSIAAGLSDHGGDTDQQLLSFRALLPEPRSLGERAPGERCPEACTAHSICWRTANWGAETEPDAVIRELSATGSMLRYEFSTKWTPAVAFAWALSVRYPTARIRAAYGEPGDLIAGRIDLEAGRTVGYLKGRGDIDVCRRSVATTGLSAIFDSLDVGSAESVR